MAPAVGWEHQRRWHQGGALRRSQEQNCYPYNSRESNSGLVRGKDLCTRLCRCLSAEAPPPPPPSGAPACRPAGQPSARAPACQHALPSVSAWCGRCIHLSGCAYQACKRGCVAGCRWQAAGGSTSRPWATQGGTRVARVAPQKSALQLIERGRRGRTRCVPRAEQLASRPASARPGRGLASSLDDSVLLLQVVRALIGAICVHRSCMGAALCAACAQSSANTKSAARAPPPPFARFITLWHGPSRPVHPLSHRPSPSTTPSRFPTAGAHAGRCG